LYVDFFVRYLAEFTISSSRLTQLKTYTQTYKPTLQYKSGEEFFPCDFYFDGDRDERNNVENYDKLVYSEKMDNLRYFVHVQEYAWDNDITEPAIAIEYWYYYVKDTGLFAHKNDWKVSIIFLKQTNPSQVLLVKAGQHGSLIERFWNDVKKEGETHVFLYVGLKHAMFFAEPKDWINGTKIGYNDPKNKPIYVWNSDPIESTNGDYDEITNWEDYHIWWDDESKYFWRWKFRTGWPYPPRLAAWRRDTWMMPEVGTYSG